MLSRRRFHSNAIGYNRRTETVTINHPRHHTVSGEHDYENREIITKHKTPQIKSEVVAFNTASGSVSFRGHSPNTPQRGASATSLRSDGEHVPLTPISSSTSGIGSLNGNITSDTKSNGAIPQSSVGASSSQAPPPIPAADPWRRQSGWLKHRKTHTRKLRHEFLRLSPGLPLSARDYVNTANASLDVSGTPLPATAIVSGGNHFSFDFVPRYLSSHSASHHNHNINYVPIEVSTKNGDFYSCGASSASSGLPGTPLTPRTPGGHNFSCEYAEIDHHKTRALSNAFRSRQKEMKTRHASCETAALINGNTWPFTFLNDHRIMWRKQLVADSTWFTTGCKFVRVHRKGAINGPSSISGSKLVAHRIQRRTRKLMACGFGHINDFDVMELRKKFTHPTPPPFVPWTIGHSSLSGRRWCHYPKSTVFFNRVLWRLFNKFVRFLSIQLIFKCRFAKLHVKS